MSFGWICYASMLKIKLFKFWQKGRGHLPLATGSYAPWSENIVKGLGAIRGKIGPTSDVDKFSPKCIHNMCFSEINTVS
jgi:hypothetical protein